MIIVMLKKQLKKWTESPLKDRKLWSKSQGPIARIASPKAIAEVIETIEVIEEEGPEDHNREINASIAEKLDIGPMNAENRKPEGFFFIMTFFLIFGYFFDFFKFS